ncbi:hypothetical protein EYF80_022746 [Liparis tanakae]|uniref:Uncharacterized protein n=1 Tax=Liparis tanakae TaxID=230148 RepID=A0A4Z2HPR1_9TELE|nr:hypothetical protein EYF80_022746 [Liparis tanakae]
MRPPEGATCPSLPGQWRPGSGLRSICLLESLDWYPSSGSGPQLQAPGPVRVQCSSSWRKEA